MVDERKVPVGYKVTEVGVIPENWDVKKLGEIGEPIIGLTYKPENIVPYGMLVLRSSNIDNNRIDLADNVYVDVEVRDRLIVEENDLLICVRNGSRRLIGKCALISKEVAGVTFGAFMSLYKSDFSRYIFQYFQTNSIKKQIEENMGATINQITNKSLSNFVIAIPENHNEQESIIEALTDTDNLIQSIEKLIEKKKEDGEETGKPTVRQLEFMVKLRSETGVPLFRDDIATRNTASDWISKTLEDKNKKNSLIYSSHER